MNILVVDDEPEFRLLMRSFLVEQGWDVVSAENGRDALLKMDLYNFDLVISDVYMPLMDGMKFHRVVRSRPELGSVPFLFVSAYDDEQTQRAVVNPRFDGFLKKGRPLSILLEWINYLTTPVADRPQFPPGR